MIMMRRIRLKLKLENLLLSIKISPPTKSRGQMVKKKRESSTINGIQAKAAKNKENYKIH